MTYESVEFEMAEGVAIVRLNEPASLNALSERMSAELVDAVARAQQEARCLVLGSVGRAFCSGANLTDGGLSLDEPDRDVGAGLETVVNPLLLAIRSSPIPILTAVRGAAAGVGCGLALAGDMVIAGQSAVFHLAFSRVGLSPDGGASYFLTRSIGRVRAMELMLLGGGVRASQALEWGLANRVVDDDQVEAVAVEIAQRIAAGPRSLSMIRRAAWSAMDASFEEQLDMERVLQREAGRTEDFVEGVQAFSEKRPALFRGR